jgi:hypothetical protein
MKKMNREVEEVEEERQNSALVQKLIRLFRLGG